MIVRESGESLLLVTQPDHARLARQIMERWALDGLPESPRRASVLAAIEHHDNGWRELDEAPSVGVSGRVDDFISIPADMRRGVWPRGVARLAADPWVAALVAQHAAFVYSRYRAEAGWRAFFVEMERLRDEFAARAGFGAEALAHDYNFVRIGDLISLAFCNAWTDQQDHAGYAIDCRGTSVMVRPDPFGGDAIPLEIDAVRIPNRPYADRDDLLRTWRGGTRVTLHGVVNQHAVPIEAELDLHAFAAADIASVVEEYVRAAHEAGLRELRLVHGRGTGTQRAAVQRVLERHPLVAEFRDDADSRLGATFCRLVTHNL